MKILKKIIYDMILSFLIILLLFVCYSKYIKKKSVVKLFGYAILVVCTDSMKQTISRNELIVIKEDSSYSLGDIVTYKDSENILITHRIVQINEAGVITKGDNNVSADGIVNIHNVKGKVIFHSKVLGIFSLYIEFIFLLYIGIVLIIFIRDVLKRSEFEK